MSGGTAAPVDVGADGRNERLVEGDLVGLGEDGVDAGDRYGWSRGRDGGRDLER